MGRLDQSGGSLSSLRSLFLVLRASLKPGTRNNEQTTLPSPSMPSNQEHSTMNQELSNHFTRENEVLVRVEGVSKKFCRDLKKSLWYGMKDVASELLPFGKQKSEIRERRSDSSSLTSDLRPPTSDLCPLSTPAKMQPPPPSHQSPENLSLTCPCHFSKNANSRATNQPSPSPRSIAEKHPTRPKISVAKRS